MADHWWGFIEGPQVGLETEFEFQTPNQSLEALLRWPGPAIYLNLARISRRIVEKVRIFFEDELC